MPALAGVAATESEPTLIRLGLLPDPARKARRLTLFGIGVFVLAAVAMTKIAVALARGRTNIAFLIIEAAVFAWLVFKVTHPLRTPAGDALLSDLRTLFAGLKDRARSLVPGSETQDFALLTAVFGMAAIPSQFPGMKRLFPKASSDSSSSSSGCGSLLRLVVRGWWLRRRMWWVWELDAWIASASRGIRQLLQVCSLIAIASIWWR